MILLGENRRVTLIVGANVVGKKVIDQDRELTITGIPVAGRIAVADFR